MPLGVGVSGEMGCDLAQGYYYAKPMPMSDVNALLENETLRTL